LQKKKEDLFKSIDSEIKSTLSSIADEGILNSKSMSLVNGFFDQAKIDTKFDISKKNVDSKVVMVQLPSDIYIRQNY